MNYVNKKGNLIELYCDETNNNYFFEKDIVKPLIKGENMKRYSITYNTRYILFPYNNGQLISKEIMTNKYPLAWEYLSIHKNYLQDREDGIMKGNNWYGYTRNQALTSMYLSKIVTPEYYAYSSFCLDIEGNYFFCGGGAGGYAIVPKKDINIKYLMGLLNSKLIEWYLKKISVRAYQTAFMYVKKYLSQLPIKVINFSTPTEKQSHDRLVSLVDQMLETQKQYHGAKSDSDKNMFKQKIDIIDKQIDDLVYKLYGLTDEEIKIVEGK